MLTGMSAGKTEEQVISPEYTHKVVSKTDVKLLVWEDRFVSFFFPAWAILQYFLDLLCAHFKNVSCVFAL